jgi:hypothetical protein
LRAGCERSEILWILLGIHGLSAEWNTAYWFGQSYDHVSRAISQIRESAQIVADLNHNHPFGTLLRAGLLAECVDLGALIFRYVGVVECASLNITGDRRWYLKTTRARLIDHVIYKASCGPHDAEIAGLIAAASGMRYSSSCHARWRRRNAYLLGDKSGDPRGSRTIDPYATATNEDRASLERLYAMRLDDPSYSRLSEELLLHLSRELKTNPTHTSLVGTGKSAGKMPNSTA